MVKSFQIKDFPDYYITDTGDVYSRYVSHKHNPQGRIHKMTPSKRPDGYFAVTLRKDGKGYAKLLHRLVAEAFIPNPYNKQQINHKNGNKADNRVSNLEWATQSENQKHRFTVLGQKGYWTGRGAEYPLSKPVLQIKDGIVIAEFYSAGEAERKTGVFHSGISACCRGEIKSSGGFQWKYK